MSSKVRNYRPRSFKLILIICSYTGCCVIYPTLFFTGRMNAVANKDNQIQVVLKNNFGVEVVDMTTLYGHNVDVDIGLKFNQSFRKSVSIPIYVVSCC